MNACLRSNDGESEFLITATTKCEYAHEAGFECRIALRSRHWDGDHTFPTRFELDGMWVGKSDLAKLRARLAEWVTKPLLELKTDDLKFKVQLATLPGQTLNLEFGERPDTVSSGKPVVSGEIGAGPVRAEYHFVTDQSCIGLFVDGLTSLTSN